MSRHPERKRSAGSTGFLAIIEATLVRLSSILFPIKLQSALGDRISFQAFVRRYGSEAKFFIRRETLLSHAINKPQNAASIEVYEFGVANGYLAESLMERHPNIVFWEGFDTFEGLPSAWRSYKAGHFSQRGRVPYAKDPRVRYVKQDLSEGNIELGLPSSSLRERTPRLFIFDLDLYEPSEKVLSYLDPLLTPLDLLYFDEAFDPE